MTRAFVAAKLVRLRIRPIGLSKSSSKRRELRQPGSTALAHSVDSRAAGNGPRISPWGPAKSSYPCMEACAQVTSHNEQ
jgi:hypothetical protein